MITLQELFESNGKAMEPQMESLASLLLKKSGDTNVFISAQGKNSLVAMIQNTSETKSFNAISSFFDTKNATIKA